MPVVWLCLHLALTFSNKHTDNNTTGFINRYDQTCLEKSVHLQQSQQGTKIMECTLRFHLEDLRLQVNKNAILNLSENKTSVWAQRKYWHPLVKLRVRMMGSNSWFPLHELTAWCDRHHCFSALLFPLAGFLCLSAAQRESWSHWAAACTHSVPLPVELERLRETERERESRGVMS